MNVIKTVKLENENYIKVFEENDLIEKLGFTIKQAEVILKYQKLFPELLQKHKVNDTIIFVRNFWEKLKEPQGDFSHWFNRKVIKKGYIDKIDYSEVYDKSVDNLLGGRPTINYKLTVDSAKHIAMSEQTVIGKEIRNYFILMEQALMDMDKWNGVREPEKDGWLRVVEALKVLYRSTHEGKEAHDWVFIHEADMINQSLFGVKAGEIRRMFQMDDDVTRNHLPIAFNNALYEIQIMDEGYIMSGVTFVERKAFIHKFCQTKYHYIPNAVNELAKVKV